MIRYVIAGLSLAIAIAAGLAWWQWVDPIKAPLVFPLSETYYARSAASEEATDKVRWANLAIKSAPARPENWMLLATAYQTEDGHLSSRALDAVRQSYAVAPLSRDVHDWRLSYVFGQWPLIPQDIRVNAINEAKIYITRPKGMRFLSQLIPNLSDPQARFTAGAIIAAHRSQARVERDKKRREEANP